MVTNDALMKKLDALEKQIQEQNKQMEELISQLSISGRTKSIVEKVKKMNQPPFDIQDIPMLTLKEFYNRWMVSEQPSLPKWQSPYPNNPFDQPEPCEETKDKLFGKEENKKEKLVHEFSGRIDPLSLNLLGNQTGKKNEDELIVNLPDSTKYGLESI
jgi:hypothetical protein